MSFLKKVALFVGKVTVDDCGARPITLSCFPKGKSPITYSVSISRLSESYTIRFTYTYSSYKAVESFMRVYSSTESVVQEDNPYALDCSCACRVSGSTSV